MPRSRAAPTVDGLVVVTYREHLSLGAGEQTEPSVLDVVGVLELVDQNVRETLAVVREDVLAVTEQLMSAQEQLGEVDDSDSPAHLLVGPVNRNETFVLVLAALLDVACAQPFVLARVDVALDLPRRPAFLVEGQIPQDTADTA